MACFKLVDIFLGPSATKKLFIHVNMEIPFYTYQFLSTTPLPKILFHDV